MKKYDQRLHHILWYSPGTLVPSEDDGGGHCCWCIGKSFENVYFRILDDYQF